MNTEAQGIQYGPHVERLKAGGFVIVWESDTNQDGDEKGVFAKIYGHIGNVLRDEFQVNNYYLSYQILAHCGELSDGRIMFVWTSYGQDGSGYGVYGRIFDNRGTPLSDDFALSDYLLGNQFTPVMCGLNEGESLTV